MKHPTRLLRLLMLMSTPIYAATPVQGFYGGLFIGATKTTSANLTLTEPGTTSSVPGSLSYTEPGGNFGGQIGYRAEELRAEFEVFLNRGVYDQLSFGSGLKLTNKVNTLHPYTMKGNTTIGAIAINVFWDLFCLFGEDHDLVPYVGAGLTYTQVKNNLQLYDNGIAIGNNLSSTSDVAGVQGIVGVAYFMDDYTSIGLDLRYFSTAQAVIFNSKPTFSSLNIIFNSTFDGG